MSENNPFAWFWSRKVPHLWRSFIVRREPRTTIPLRTPLSWPSPEAVADTIAFFFLIYDHALLGWPAPRREPRTTESLRTPLSWPSPEAEADTVRCSPYLGYPLTYCDFTATYAEGALRIEDYQMALLAQNGAPNHLFH